MLTSEANKARASRRPERILIVEDEESIREAIAHSLQRESYEVLTAADGTAGLDLMQRGNAAIAFDLLILDLMLPDMSGFDLCRQIRHQGSNLPILIISAKSSEGDRVTGLDLGADDYLPKPFGMRELIARCRVLLRRWDAPPPPPPLLTVRDIVLNLHLANVLVRGKEISLSPKEFQLLEIFMLHPRQVLTREQLMKQVWGREAIGDYKTLDVHVRWLREKLEINPSQPEYLITMRGFGYRFC
ncbi:MAG: response regulator transcription factor [Drouetiella hepatica Uher 2000/2452]|jgi:two-component system phosphate regulon response regulator PhoB|uniref:Response regulator transcription factor n=1 Tax=Drouetiella hepatica Uher 2000/2452 TaxID=904376 RepID=A0A951Q8T9_9CYAN|nr:response regulator transcription factor [Drouetiella hepatica Uher 2000/2452]